MSELQILSYNEKIWYKNLTWNATDAGQYLICSTASDTSNSISISSCYTILVGTTITSIIEDTIYPIGLVNSFASNVLTFKCNYTTEIMKPTISAYINIYSALDDARVLKIDSSAANTTRIINRVQMAFDVFLMSLDDGYYYITMDYGKQKSLIFFI